MAPNDLQRHWLTNAIAIENLAPFYKAPHSWASLLHAIPISSKAAESRVHILEHPI